MRSLISSLLACTLLLAITSASAVAAELRPVEAGAAEEVLVDDGHAVWIDGSRVMRTDLKTGLAKSIGRIPSKRVVMRAEVGGGKVSLGTIDFTAQKSAVYMVDTAHGARRVAFARWYPKRTSRCGSSVWNGPVSPSGELTWHVYTPIWPSTRKKCAETNSRTQFLMQTLIGRPGDRAVSLIPTKTMTTEKINDSASQFNLSQIVAVNTRFILLGVRDTAAALVSRRSGRVIRRVTMAGDHNSFASALTANGTVIGASRLRNTVDGVTHPILFRKSGKRHLAAWKKDSYSKAMFCGTSIVQVTQIENDAEDRVAIVERRRTGALKRVLVSPETSPPGRLLGAACDASSLVVKLDTTKPEPPPVGGIGTGTGTVSTETRGTLNSGPAAGTGVQSYVLDLRQ